MTLERNVAAALERHNMLGRGHRLGVAVSGGADSVFLLHALHEMGLAAAVLHVNHKLRGDESDMDEQFVRRLASDLGLPVAVSDLPLPNGNIEQEARRSRYRFFAEQLKAGCCDTVATGHSLDDQAETVLSRFLRGSGTAGLSGIRPVTTDGIVRPLLEIRRDDIRNRLRERNLPWREDRSNVDPSYMRNRLRLQVIPMLMELNAALPRTLASVADWAREEEVYWNQEVERIGLIHFLKDEETVLLRSALFCNLPIAVQRRLLRHGVEHVRGTLRGIEFHHVEAIRSLMNSSEGSGRIQLPDLDVYRSFDWLRFAPVGYDSRLERNFEIPLAVPGRATLPERRLSIEMELVTRSRVYTKQVDALDAARCASPLVLRNWRPGDAYCPYGKSSTEKIKTLFQEYRIPLWRRRNWPVITLGDIIFWARQFGVASQYAAAPEARQVILIRESEESKPAYPSSTKSVHMQSQRAENRAEVS